MAWLIRAMRLTAFAPHDCGDWQVPGWRALIASDPENSLTPAPGVRLEEGPLGVGRLQIARQQGPTSRADVMYAPQGLPRQVAQTATASLGDFEEATAVMRPIIAALLQSGIPIARLGLAVEFFELAADLDAANRALAGKIDNRRPDLAEAQDIIYQINRRRRSLSVPTLTINRVARWTVTAPAVVVGSQPPANIAFEVANPSVSLVTDVNSEAEHRGALPANSLEPLWDELRALTNELATYGDIP